MKSRAVRTEIGMAHPLASPVYSAAMRCGFEYSRHVNVNNLAVIILRCCAGICVPFPPA